MKYDQNKVGDLLQPVAKLVGDVTRDLHKLVDPKVGFDDHDDDAGGGGVVYVDDDVIVQAGEPVCRWEKKKWCEPVSFIVTIMIMINMTLMTMTFMITMITIRVKIVMILKMMGPTDIDIQHQHRLQNFTLKQHEESVWQKGPYPFIQILIIKYA